MSNQSESVLTAAAAVVNLKPLAEVLPEQWREIITEYVGDIAVMLSYNPGEPEPFHVSVAGAPDETETYADEAAARVALQGVVAEIEDACREKGGAR